MPIANDYVAIAKAAFPPNNEPDYWAQTAEPMTQDEIRTWVIDAAEDARNQGCTETRVAWCDDVEPMIILLEGWKVRPDPWPTPHFHVTTDP